MATHRPVQVPGGGILTRMFGLDPYDEARKIFEQMYTPVFPSRNNYFPIETHRRQRHPNLLNIHGRRGIDRYALPQPPAGLPGGFPGGMMNNNCYHGGNVYHDGNRSIGNYQGGNYSRASCSNSIGEIDPMGPGGLYVRGSRRTDPFRRDFYDRDWCAQHFRYRTEHQIRELRTLFEYDYHLTQEDLDELRYGTHERFELLIRYLRRQDARLRRSEETLRRHCRSGDRAGQWDGLRRGSLGFDGMPANRFESPRRQTPHLSDRDLDDDDDDLEYASSLSDFHSGDDTDGYGGRRFRFARRRDASPAPSGGVGGRYQGH